MLDVVDRRGERALVRVDDALLDFLRAQTGVLPDDADDRDFNVGENVRGRPQQHKRRQQQQQERCDHERVRTAEGELSPVGLFAQTPYIECFLSGNHPLRPATNASSTNI